MRSYDRLRSAGVIPLISAERLGLDDIIPLADALLAAPTLAVILESNERDWGAAHDFLRRANRLMLVGIRHSEPLSFDFCWDGSRLITSSSAIATYPRTETASESVWIADGIKREPEFKQALAAGACGGIVEIWDGPSQSMGETILRVRALTELYLSMKGETH